MKPDHRIDAATSLTVPILQAGLYSGRTSARSDSQREGVCDWSICYADQFLAPAPGLTLWSDGWFGLSADIGDRRRFHVSFEDFAEFLVDFAEKKIVVCDDRSCSPQGALHLIRDQIIPRVLAHEGKLVLHAASVATPGGAILLVGPSGSGKSSLSASLHNAGSPLLGDDATVVTIDGSEIRAHAVYRSLRLYPDSIAALGRFPARQTPVASYTTKRNVIFLDDRLSEERLPIRAVFMLTEPHGETVEIQSIEAPSACMAFVEHSFWMDPTDVSHAKARMEQASALAAAVPAFSLNYPREFSWLPAVRDAIATTLARPGASD